VYEIGKTQRFNFLKNKKNPKISKDIEKKKRERDLFLFFDILGSIRTF
jgi:hypothetical protein